jgi:hypothetical protein
LNCGSFPYWRRVPCTRKACQIQRNIRVIFEQLA